MLLKGGGTVFVYDMLFVFSDDADDIDYRLTDYLCMLSGNNQIVFESLNISGSAYQRTARVTVPFQDSLEERWCSADVRAALERLQPHLKEPIHLSYVGEDFTYGDDCHDGGDTEYYVLKIHPHLRDMSPICDGDTEGNIPYYLLPTICEDTVGDLTKWETTYAAYDQLVFTTGIGEISAHKMLSNISSRLNRQGMSICRNLEAELERPVYYYLYRFYGKHPKTCPLCGGNWKCSVNEAYSYRCDTCRIVADRSSNDT